MRSPFCEGGRLLGSFTIDLTGVRTLRALHEAIRDGLRLPEYYGMNLDALWDCLSSGDVMLPCKVRVLGLGALPGELGEYAVRLRGVLGEAQRWWRSLENVWNLNLLAEYMRKNAPEGF